MAQKPQADKPSNGPTFLGKPGPFQVVELDGTGELDSPIEAPRRRYECTNYESCLALAAALNWDSFTCRGCNGEIDPSLCWRAHQSAKKDKIADQICELPSIELHEATNNTPLSSGAPDSINTLHSSDIKNSDNKVLYLSRKRTVSGK